METHKPSLKTETRHSKTGNACHHFVYHRLTCDEYDRLRARAAGHCEICGTPEGRTGGKRLVVDHFGAPGIHLVRGLLCDSCNAFMSCLDGTKRWGADRRREAKAWEYEAASWQRPTAEQAETMEAVRSQRAAHQRYVDSMKG